jgi:hypothetical protein
MKNNLSISFKFQTEIYFYKMKLLMNPKLVYLILGLMWTLNLSTLDQFQCYNPYWSFEVTSFKRMSF